MSIVLQASITLQSSILNSGNVVFDQLSFNSGDITYDNTTGQFTINSTGEYYFTWWVATSSSLSNSGIGLVLTDNDVIERYANTPLKNNQFSGLTVVDVDSVPKILELKNISNAVVYLPTSFNIKGSIAVFKESQQNGEISTSCFAYRNFAHILSQYVEAYSENTWTVFSNSLASFNGTPLSVYTSPQGNSPGFLILLDGSNNLLIFNINQITGIYPGADTFYDPNFTFLTPPDPLTPGCDTDILTAFTNYLEVGTEITFRMGPSVSGSGGVYKNEIGVLVISDESGSTPILIPTPQILLISTANNNNNLMAKSNKPTIIIETNDVNKI